MAGCCMCGSALNSYKTKRYTTHFIKFVFAKVQTLYGMISVHALASFFMLLFWGDFAMLLSIFTSYLSIPIIHPNKLAFLASLTKVYSWAQSSSARTGLAWLPIKRYETQIKIVQRQKEKRPTFATPPPLVPSRKKKTEISPLTIHNLAISQANDAKPLSKP